MMSGAKFASVMSNVNIVPLWHYIDKDGDLPHTQLMPRTRMDELYALAEEHDGLLPSKEARALGIKDSVLVRLAQRGRLERMSRGVYRIAHYPADRLAQYREAILWARASQGPEHAALSHETALVLYGISDVNPSHVHLTVPLSARLRRERPKWITIHRADLAEDEIHIHEGLPVTAVARSIMDVLATSHRAEIARQAIVEALREGLINAAQAGALRKQVNRTVHALTAATTKESQATADESSPR
jgi:predicted transcriptional regulator of viral defense system